MRYREENDLVRDRSWLYRVESELVRDVEWKVTLNAELRESDPTLP